MIQLLHKLFEPAFFFFLLSQNMEELYKIFHRLLESWQEKIFCLDLAWSVATVAGVWNNVENVKFLVSLLLKI